MSDLVVIDYTTSDPDGDDVKISVDWGDGNSSDSTLTSPGQYQIDHLYSESGYYDISVTPVDAGGDSGSPVTRTALDVWNKGNPPASTTEESSWVRRTGSEEGVVNGATISGTIVTFTALNHAYQKQEFYPQVPPTASLGDRYAQIRFRVKVTGDVCPLLRCFIQGVHYESGNWYNDDNNQMNAQYRVPNDGQWHWVCVAVHINDKDWGGKTQITTVNGLGLKWYIERAPSRSGWSMPTIEIDTDAVISFTTNPRAIQIPGAPTKSEFIGNKIRVGKNGVWQKWNATTSRWEFYPIKAYYYDWNNTDQTDYKDAGFNIAVCDLDSRAQDAASEGLDVWFDWSTATTGNWSNATIDATMNNLVNNGVVDKITAWYFDVENDLNDDDDRINYIMGKIAAVNDNSGKRDVPVIVIAGHTGMLNGWEDAVGYNVDLVIPYANTQEGQADPGSVRSTDAIQPVVMSTLCYNSVRPVGAAVTNTPNTYSYWLPVHFFAMAGGAYGGIVAWHQPNNSNALKSVPDWSTSNMLSILDQLYAYTRKAVDPGSTHAYLQDGHGLYTL